LALFQLVKIVH